ncbi:S10 family serine carboxypeptidase-like protein [Roseateles violae]|uniref:Peptidase S10 n=1 Tax=Roseateles violae TaxID=3058042 RepID=A0ABT8DW72_9BURK|nr:peptidase S10 [Pelomonas sp. PFR6]MDN3922477.1 peptidase S10 [Pelomonas sp. PFR6]
MSSSPKVDEGNGGRPRARLAGACLALLLGLLAACGGGGGGSGSAPEPPAVDPALVVDPTVYASGASDSLPSASEAAAQTEQRLTLASGATLDYTASVGHLNAGTPAGASMFYIAYTAKGAPATRPIVFFYNGGPGSASVWLHLGSWGPKRLVTNMPSTTLPQATLVDNPLSLLGEADLVFVDAVGTGYSQAIAPNNNRSFWGVDQDAAIFRDFVLRYTAKTQRGSAPLLLYGESYGGLRTPILAQALLAAGAPLKGLVLQSAILDYNSNCAVLEPGRLSCGSFVPSYGATAAWFQRARPQPANLDAALPGFVQGIVDYVGASYEPAAQLYLSSHLPLSMAMSQQLADYSGLAASDWQTAPLLGPEQYRRLLLPQQLLGRYDSRIAAALGTPLASEGDPSNTVLTAAFRGAIGDYLRQLKYQAAVPYLMFNEASINLWDWRHDGHPLPDAIPDLALALTLKPDLKVFVIGGYHDLATPFRQTELDLARLGSAPAGLQLRRYVGGHMTYLDEQVRPALAADLTVLLRGLAATP